MEDPAPPPDAVAARRLAEPAFVASLLDRFQASHRGADRRAVVSYWSQIYFGALTSAAVATAAQSGGVLPSRLDDMLVSVCPKTGAPVGVHMTVEQDVGGTGPLLAPLIEEHVAPLIGILRRQSGLSAHLLWENAAWPLIWSLGQVARLGPGADVGPQRLVGWTPGPPGRSHRLDRALQALAVGLPFSRCRCCLRDRLPGLERCAGLCPLR